MYSHLLKPSNQPISSQDNCSGDIDLCRKTLIAIMERERSVYAKDEENFMATELRLGLPGSDNEPPPLTTHGYKRTAAPTREGSERTVEMTSNYDDDDHRDQECWPIAKSQVIGWPPVRSCRRNSFLTRKAETVVGGGGGGGVYVKVSMDGAPYLRKVDLKLYQSYEEFREVLEDMFKCFCLGDLSPETTGGGGGGSNYAVAYEDKEGDWMLVGDVPWRMFVSSCKRLRIMKRCGAKGLSSSA